MCAANCAQLASTKIGWANKAKEIAVDTARLVEVESKFQFYPQCGLSPPRLGPFLGHSQNSKSQSLVGDSRSSSRIALTATLTHLWGVDRKSTRLNSSHQIISYAVFCLKK